MAPLVFVHGVHFVGTSLIYFVSVLFPLALLVPVLPGAFEVFVGPDASFLAEEAVVEVGEYEQEEEEGGEREERVETVAEVQKEGAQVLGRRRSVLLVRVAHRHRLFHGEDYNV